MTKNLKLKLVLGFVILFYIFAVIISFASCTSVKKVVSKEIHHKDSLSVGKRLEIVDNNTQTTNNIKNTNKSDVISEIEYQLLSIDSGYLIHLPLYNLDYLITKPTKIVLPRIKVVSNNVVSMTDQSVIIEKNTNTSSLDTKVEVSTDTKVINKEVKRLKFPTVFVISLIILIIIGYIVNKKYHIYESIRKML